MLTTSKFIASNDLGVNVCIIKKACFFAEIVAGMTICCDNIYSLLGGEICDIAIAEALLLSIKSILHPIVIAMTEADAIT